jgi:hypothetical protein
LERLLTVNPEMKSVLEKQKDEKVEGDQSQMNQLSNNFVLIKTYEQTMKQYEHELENFKLRTQQFEEEQAILIQKNSDLGQQLYVMKTRISKGGDPSALTSTDEEKIDRIEKD